MLPALAYELPAPSTAVVDRKQHCRAYPSSASTLSLTGTRSCRIRLGGEDFIEPSLIRLMLSATRCLETSQTAAKATLFSW